MTLNEDKKLALHETILMAMEGGDESVLAAVVQFLDGLTVAAPGLVSVKYVGRRPEYSDGNYGTGWWKKDQSKLIVEAVASRMFEHTGVYVPGDTVEAKVAESVPKKEVDDTDPALQDARDAILNMSRKAAVQEFVAANYNGLVIPDSYKTLPEMKAFAIQQVDIYRIPGV